jgi:hypothetical protein
VTEKLTDLIVREDELVEQQLVSVLQLYVQFTDRGDLLLQPDFDVLTTEAQVACVLLAIKALGMVGLRSLDAATPAEIVALSGLPGGTVRPKLRDLLKRRCVARNSDGRYFMPTNAIHRTIEVLRHAR